MNDDSNAERQDAMLEHGLEIGRLLRDVRPCIKHDKFRRWVEVNCRFSYRTAQRYMALTRSVVSDE
jgi:hypothetical protein